MSEQKYAVRATLTFFVVADNEDDAMSVVETATTNPMDLEGCEWIATSIAVVDTLPLDKDDD